MQELLGPVETEPDKYRWIDHYNYCLNITVGVSFEGSMPQARDVLR